MTVDQMFEILYMYFEEQENAIRMHSAIDGRNADTACDMLYYLSGYHDFKQFLEDIGSEL